MKSKIRNIIILISFAIIGVVTFQTSWLINNYKISREQAKLDIKGILDDALREHNAKVAIRFRGLLKHFIKSDSDFSYHILHWPYDMITNNTGVQVGFAQKQGPNYAYVLYVIPPGDTIAIKNNPYAYLMKKIEHLNLDELGPLYSALISPHPNNPDHYGDEAKNKLADSLKEIYDSRIDTGLLNKILEKDFTNKGLTFKGTVRFYRNLVWFYRDNRIKFKPLPHDEMVQTVFDSPDMITSYPQQLNAMHNYMDKLSSQNDSLYIEKFTPATQKDILSFSVPGIMLAVKTPAVLIFREMIASIIGSGILLLFLGSCIVYMFYLILQQKKLADVKNDFISNISHELKTPIATTLAAVQGMQYFDVLKDNKKTELYLATASDELQRLSSMVNKILNISIFENNGFALNPVMFNFKDLLESIIAAQQIRQEKPVDFTLQYTGDENIFADKTHLHNVIINMVDNAIKYSGDKVNIRIQGKNQPGETALSISDDGQGIAEEFQKNVFDKFFRVPRPNDHSIKGYGLGLNYVKNIVEKHGGTVFLKSSFASGSTFIIKIPQNAVV